MSHIENLGTINLSISTIKDLIKNSIMNSMTLMEKGISQDTKLPYHIIGPAGVGKTQICMQLCNELSQETNKHFHFYRILGPTLFRDDFIVPFPKLESDNDGHRRFEMLYSDFMPKANEEFGIFMIDEFSRSDQQLQQMLWQIMNERRLHTYTFPKGWFIIIADNPDEEEYSMQYQNDAAGMRRSSKYGVMVESKCWIEYAESKGFHDSVVGFINAHPEALYDHQSLQQQKIYANPATWERVSDELHGFEARDIDIRGTGHLGNLVEMTLVGMLNITMTKKFKEYLLDRFVSAEEIIVINDKKVETKLENLKKHNDIMALSSTMAACLSYLVKNKPAMSETTNEYKNFLKFITSVPADVASLIITKTRELSEKHENDSMTYMQKLILLLTKNNDFRKNVHDPMVESNKISINL